MRTRSASCRGWRPVARLSVLGTIGESASQLTQLPDVRCLYRRTLTAMRESVASRHRSSQPVVLVIVEDAEAGEGSKQAAGLVGVDAALLRQLMQ